MYDPNAPYRGGYQPGGYPPYPQPQSRGPGPAFYVALGIALFCVVAIVTILDLRSVQGTMSRFAASTPTGRGRPAPDFAVTGTDGQSVSLSEFRGHVVVLDFWATWCGPCQESLPNTEKLAEDYRNKGVVFLGVNVWDDQDKFNSWIGDHSQFTAMRFAIDQTDDGKHATDLYGVDSIPTQVVISPKGTVVDIVQDVDDESDLRSAIDDALKYNN